MMVLAIPIHQAHFQVVVMDYQLSLQIFVNGKDFKVVTRQKGLYIDPKTNQPTGGTSRKREMVQTEIYLYGEDIIRFYTLTKIEA
jgi:hypothetical protein